MREPQFHQSRIAEPPWTNEDAIGRRAPYGRACTSSITALKAPPMSNDLNSLRARPPYISIPEFCQGGKTALQKGTQIISSLIRIRLCKRRQRHAPTRPTCSPRAYPQQGWYPFCPLPWRARTRHGIRFTREPHLTRAPKNTRHICSPRKRKV